MGMGFIFSDWVASDIDIGTEPDKEICSLGLNASGLK